MAVVGCGGTRTTCNGVERVQVARREVNGYKGVVVASEQKLLLLLLLLQMCSVGRSVCQRKFNGTVYRKKRIKEIKAVTEPK